jgi:E3 ubiquitin-protein ligase RFWD3
MQTLSPQLILQTHQLVQLEMSDLQYSTESYCAICDLYFVSPNERGEHVSNSLNHPRCETCDRRFLNKNILRNVR